MAKSKTPATDEYLAALVKLLEAYADKRGRKVRDEWVPRSDFTISRELLGWQDFASRLRQGKVTVQKAREFEEKCREGLS